MRQTDRNKMFEYFKNEHKLLLTEDDIDDILYFVEEKTNQQVNSFIQDRIASYRYINIVIFVLVGLILGDEYIKWVVFVFVIYNLFLVLRYRFNKKNNGRVLRK